MAVLTEAISDEDLVRATIDGQPNAFGELVRRWAPRILALCHSKVGPSGAAEDLAQETLLRGFRAIRTLAEPAKFGSWLYGIALRTCLDWLKAKERSMVNFSSLASDRSLDEVRIDPPRREEPELDQREETERLVSEVEALPEECREVVMLRYYQDLKYRDMARILSVSAATINARLSKARSLLRQRLKNLQR